MNCSTTKGYIEIMKKVQKPLEKWEKEALMLLENFRFSPRTNLSDRRISNHDAAAYLSFKCGTLAARRLTHLLRIWRARSAVKFAASTYAILRTKPVLTTLVKMAQAAMKLQFTYLFNRFEWDGDGFVGRNFESTHNEVTYYPYGGPPKIVERATYWYRSYMRGFYATTKIGAAHGANLESKMRGVLNVA